MAVEPDELIRVALLAPMPRARTRNATVVNPGAFASVRLPYRRSCRSWRMGLVDVHPLPEVPIRSRLNALR